MAQLQALDCHCHAKSFAVCCLLSNTVRSFHYQQGKSESTTRTQEAKQVFAQTSILYKKANIPMILEVKACQEMLKLLDKQLKLRAVPIARRLQSAL